MSAYDTSDRATFWIAVVCFLIAALLFAGLAFGATIQTATVVQSEITPDGARLVELADYDRRQVFELWQTPSTPNGQRSRIGPAVNSQKDVAWFRVAPNSSRVVWVEVDTAHGGSRLLSSNWTSGVAALSLTLAEVRGFSIMCDSKSVSLTGAKIAGDEGAFFCVPITGGVPTDGWCPLPDCHELVFADGFERGTTGAWR